MRFISRFGVIKAATFLLLGLSAGRAGHAQIVNGSFETGNLSGWTRAGFLDAAGGPTTGAPNFATFMAARAAGASKADTNAAVNSQTTSFDGLGTAGPAVNPTNSAFLAFVSNQTSAGDSTLTGSSLTQTFVIPADAGLLRFDVAFLTNEVVNLNTINDFGGVALSQGATTLQQFNIDVLGTADAGVDAGVPRGGFDSSTVFMSQSFDVSGLRGQTVTLTAYALNYGGDNFTESRLLLDNVNIAVVPEPGAFPLLATPLAALAGRTVLRRRRNP